MCLLIYNLIFLHSSHGLQQTVFVTSNPENWFKIELTFRFMLMNAVSVFFPFQFVLFVKHMLSFIWMGIILKKTSCTEEPFVGNYKAWPFCSFLKVYTSTAILSSLLFKGYGKLSSAEKIEWNNRWNACKGKYRWLYILQTKCFFFSLIRWFNLIKWYYFDINLPQIYFYLIF